MNFCTNDWVLEGQSLAKAILSYNIIYSSYSNWVLLIRTKHNMNRLLFQRPCLSENNFYTWVVFPYPLILVLCFESYELFKGKLFGKHIKISFLKLISHTKWLLPKFEREESCKGSRFQILKKYSWDHVLYKVIKLQSLFKSSNRIF